jgi:imidazolonepropionase
MGDAITLLLTNITQLITLQNGLVPRVGPSMAKIGLVEDGAVAISGSRIVAAGPVDAVRSQCPAGKSTRVIDCRGRVVTPGFIDSHTHPVFADFRLDEYELRTEGVSYQEIAKRGGGIVSSLSGVRHASEEDLLSRSLRRLDGFLLHGTTTIEAKSGYGLTLMDEKKSLRVIRRLGELHPLDLVPTFLGAHAVPPESAGRKAEYIDRIVREMIPEIARKEMARFCDVFMEEGYFDGKETKKILSTAQSFGLGTKIHADELSPMGGAELAAGIGAVSADHLVCVSENGMRAMAERGVIAVLLPGTTFFLGSKRYAPAREMIDLGVPVALASDFNPGSCPTRNLQQILSLAVTQMAVKPAEAMTAVTINAACAVDMEEDVGTLEPGKQADIAIFATEDFREIPYLFGSNHCETVIKRGKVVVEGGRLVGIVQGTVV